MARCKVPVFKVHCCSKSSYKCVVLTLKRAGLFGPISQPGGGGGFHPPKISETDWRNIKCVVLVDSYDPPESIGTKKKYKYTLYEATVMS